MTVRDLPASERPAVLLVEANDDRRQIIARDLADAGYEVVPTTSPDEGLRFARGLGPSVIVGPVSLLEIAGSEFLESCKPSAGMERTLLLLGDPEDDTLGDRLPDEVLLLKVTGLSGREVLRRIRLVLLGREIGLDPDLELRTLVGELALNPLLELVRSLHRCELSGRLRVPNGRVIFDHGRVVAAAAGEAQGVKAFCRLARFHDGPLRITPTNAPEVDEEIFEDVPSLVMRALEESQLELPAPQTRLRVLREPRRPSPDDSGASYTHQDLLIEAVSRCATVGELLNVLPSTDGRVLKALEKMLSKGVVALERPRAAVAVVTDSTADLPPDLALAHDIEVVPLSVVFGEDVLRDGVDIQPRDFYKMLQTEPSHPSTRPPSEAEFLEYFLAQIEERDILAVHISGRLSETAKNARRAALSGGKNFDLPEARKDFALEVVDSKNVSMGVGLMALFASRMASRGEGAARISKRLEAMTDRMHTLFVVDTLDYLVRGGRIGKAKALVGKILGIKPILGVVDGEVVPVDRALGGRQAHSKIVKLFRERIDPKRPVVVAVAHAQAPVWADRLRKLLEAELEVAELIRTDVGPVVGTHAGPGCVGAVLFQPTGEEWEMVQPL